MKNLIRASLVIALILILPACGGATVACKRYADGSIECGVTIHADGNHDKPVPKAAP